MKLNAATNANMWLHHSLQYYLCISNYRPTIEATLDSALAVKNMDMMTCLRDPGRLPFELLRRAFAIQGTTRGDVDFSLCAERANVNAMFCAIRCTQSPMVARWS